MKSMFRTQVATSLRALKGIVLGLKALPGFMGRRRSMKSLPTAFILSVGGPHSGSAWITERAANLGFRPIVVSQKLPFRELGYAAGWVKLDAIHQATEIAELAKKEDVRLILSDHRNFLLNTASHVQKELGLRSLGENGPKTSNDKISFRRALDAANAPNLKWAELDASLSTALPLPFIAKPTRGTGSRGVMKIETDADLEDLRIACATDTEDRGWIAEEYVPARQFDVEGVVRDGEVFPLSVTEEHYKETSGKFPSAWFLFSPPIPEQWTQILKDTAAKTLAACGVQNGAFHVEIRLPDDLNAVPIDYSNRYGYPIMVSEASDVDFVELYARSLMDDDFVAPIPARNSVFQVYCSNERQSAAAKRLIQEHPETVIEARMLGSVVGGVQTYGRVSLKTARYEEMSEMLERFGLRPDIWDDLYEGAGKN